MMTYEQFSGLYTTNRVSFCLQVAARTAESYVTGSYAKLASVVGIVTDARDDYATARSTTRCQHL